MLHCKLKFTLKLKKGSLLFLKQIQTEFSSSATPATLQGLCSLTWLVAPHLDRTDVVKISPSLQKALLDSGGLRPCFSLGGAFPLVITNKGSQRGRVLPGPFSSCPPSCAKEKASGRCYHVFTALLLANPSFRQKQVQGNVPAGSQRGQTF